MNDQESASRDQPSGIREQRPGIRDQGNNGSPTNWVPQMPLLRPGRFTGPAVILLAAFCATLPQLLFGTSCGHDFDFHLVSWFDALQNWRQGILYPHWSPSANYGAGEPRFIFYPPVSWMLGAILGAMIRWKAVAMAITFLFLAGTGLSTRALARQVLREGPATLAGCEALFSGYALFTAYERTDFGELAGGFWIPLLLLLILRERNRDGSVWQRAFDGSTALLAVVLAGAWLSNAPLGVMASYLLAAVTLVIAMADSSWAPFLRASVAAVLGLCLCSFFWLPAAYEQRWVDMSQILGDPGYRVENNWLFARHADPALELHDLELLKASGIAVTMLAVAFAGIAICWLRGKMRTPLRWWLPLALIPPVVLFLQFPVSDWLWNLLPKIRFLEFPWRWLVVLQAPMAIFFAAAVWVNRATWRMLVLAGCVIVFAFATLFAAFNFFQECDEEDAVWAMLGVYRSGAGFEGTDEYEPPWADNSLVAMNLPTACLATSPTIALGQGAAGTVPVWAANQGSCDATFRAAPNQGKPAAEHLRISADIPHAGFLILRLRSYPAWRVRRNGKMLDHLPQRDDGLIAVPVVKGPTEIAVDWTTTRDVVLSRWLTILALVLVTGLCVAERKLAAPRVS